MKIAFIVAFLALVIAVQAQTNSNCSQCQNTFLVTGNTLWMLNSAGNLTQCATGFCNARSVAADQNGNLFVADEGDLSIWQVPSSCNNQKKLIARNDGAAFSWLYPHSITVDNNNNLIVAMNQFDPLWTQYSEPRRRLARGNHVYLMNIDSNFNLTGNIDILAGGINNGRDIFYVNYDRDSNTLWGTRSNHYLVRFINNLWEDWLGPNNIFRLNTPLIGGLRQVAPAFARCGYLAVADDVDSQFLECTDVNNVSSCSALCPNLINGTFASDLFDDCSNSQDSIVGNVVSINVNGGQSGSQSCQSLVSPYSVAIDCECNLLVSDLSSRQLLRFPFQNQSSSSSLLGSAQVLLAQMDQVIYSMVPVTAQNCTVPQPTPQPTATAQPTAAPEPTPQPTATAQPTSAPVPEPTPSPEPVPTNEPTPQPTSTAQPTSASTIFRRLGLIH